MLRRASCCYGWVRPAGPEVGAWSSLPASASFSPEVVNWSASNRSASNWSTARGRRWSGRIDAAVVAAFIC